MTNYLSQTGRDKFPAVKLSQVLTESKIESQSLDISKRLRVRLNTNGVEKRPETNEIEGATKYYIRKAGQFVYGRQNLHKGAFGIVPQELDGFESSADIPAFDVTENCIPEWIDLFFKQDNFYQRLSKLASGVGSKRISPEKFLNLEIPLPALSKQKEILNKVCSNKIILQKLSTELNQQQTLLKKLRQQILQEAIEGKLTADWRAANSNVEPASELLKRIAAEKAQLVKNNKIKSQKPLPPIKDEEKPFDLPMGWVWCRLSHIIYEDPRNGYSPKAVDFVTETKTLKLGATTKGFFDSMEYKYINEIIDDDSYLWLENGDILIQRSNSLDHVGVSAIYDGGFHEFIYPDIMMKIKVVGLIPTPFVFNVLSSKLCRKYFRKNATGAQKSMPKINQGVVSKALIALPPLHEQQEILKKIEKIFALCDQLEAQISQNKSYAEQLMQAVLKEAFQPITN